MGENEKLAEGTLYIIEPDGTETPIGEVGEPLESLELPNFGPEEEADAQKALEYLLTLAMMRDFAEYIAIKYPQVVRLWLHGKTERTRKKNHHRLRRLMRKEVRRYGRVD